MSQDTDFINGQNGNGKSNLENAVSSYFKKSVDTELNMKNKRIIYLGDP